MGSEADREAFSLLRVMERRATENAFGLPERAEAEATWEAVAFRLRGVNLLASMEEVTELLSPPKLTAVPGAKRWVKGIANVRGTLLAIVDLGLFLGRGSQPLDRRSRVLVVRAGAMSTGLLVDEVLGVRQLRSEERTAEPLAADEHTARFLRGAYQRDGAIWGVFAMRPLLESAEFMAVAL